MKNTKEKDRQTQVKVVFILMAILCGDKWLTIDEIAKELKNKGYSRCHRTIRRLLSTLKELNFNLMCKKNTNGYLYKGNKKRIFLYI
jgi:repressor of nif and glnA expression